MKIIPSKRIAFDERFSKVVNSKTGWYRGDFHTHTSASDGIYPADILAGVEAGNPEAIRIWNQMKRSRRD